MQRATQFIVYLAGGLAFGFFTTQAIGSAVWGAPTHPLQYLALCSSILLAISAFISLFAPATGRIAATISLLGVGSLYIPASASLVPADTLVIRPLAYCLEAGYFALLAFAVLFPTRWRFSVSLLACCVLASSVVAAATLYRRWQDGEYRRPALAYFAWSAEGEGLKIEGDTAGWIGANLQKSLIEHGVTGVLRWSGSQGYPSREYKVLVICRSKVRASKDLHYPRKGTVIYVFDGNAWKSIPDQPQTYAAHATLEPDGMVNQATSGVGIEGTTAFAWR